jgi:hypothetical protein
MIRYATDIPKADPRAFATFTPLTQLELELPTLEAERFVLLVTDQTNGASIEMHRARGDKTAKEMGAVVARMPSPEDLMILAFDPSEWLSEPGWKR